MMRCMGCFQVKFSCLCLNCIWNLGHHTGSHGKPPHKEMDSPRSLQVGLGGTSLEIVKQYRLSQMSNSALLSQVEFKTALQHSKTKSRNSRYIGQRGSDAQFLLFVLFSLWGGLSSSPCFVAS